MRRRKAVTPRARAHRRRAHPSKSPRSLPRSPIPTVGGTSQTSQTGVASWGGRVVGGWLLLAGHLGCGPVDLIQSDGALNCLFRLRNDSVHAQTLSLSLHQKIKIKKEKGSRRKTHETVTVPRFATQRESVKPERVTRVRRYNRCI